MDRTMRLQHNPDVVARELAGPEGAVLLHLDTGAYHGLNPVGFAVWDLVDGTRTVAEIIDGVRARVASAPPELESDVVAFLENALARDLVRPAGSSAG